MSFALGQNGTTKPGTSSTAQFRPGMSPSEAFALLGQLRSQSDQQGQQGGFINQAFFDSLKQPTPGLPPLPQIPPLTKAPSRLSTRQIAGAARSLRVAASKRKGRASTILGGSIGADPERKTLLGA